MLQPPTQIPPHPYYFQPTLGVKPEKFFHKPKSMLM